MKRLLAFIDEDRGLYALAGLLMISEFALIPVAGAGALRVGAANALLGLALAGGAFCVAPSRRLKVFIVAVAIVGAVVLLLPSSNSTLTGRTVLFSLRFVLLLILTGVIGAAVFSPGRVNAHRVVGAVVLYLQLALLFGDAYSLIADFSPNAFAFQHPNENTAWPLYFSFSTITTVGYGDIAPVSPFARSLAGFEAVFGTLYPSTVIARLLTLR